MSRMRFTFLTGDVNWETYGGKWVSRKLNNGEFDYWLILEFTNMQEAMGDGYPSKYHVQLNVVSPDQAGEDNLNRALSGYDIHAEDLTDLVKVEALDAYGVKASIWQQSGENVSKLLKEARKQAQMSELLFGFFMDKPENKIGTTGWEAIRGDLNSALDRTICSGSTEGRILGKMHGLTDKQIEEACEQTNPKIQS